ncbi:protein SCO1/2 [Planktotalea frisia]|jgi:protein SCO1/2|uniref:SCO1/SenC n=1 Tax=Planktotalea frisia TaxID=696762 RepID=A0A1L9NT95_9RHOB|nr:SCO family protein [Planktotalea frisia]OJI92536.1 SCO1/SenC [Planktotalea frisia]PZX24003.1 protein SCO1/2 [Planktotalea frisia]
MTRLLAIFAALAVVLALFGVWFATQSNGSDDQFAQCRIGQVAGGTAQIGGPFTLLDKTGTEVTDKDVITKPSLVYFGYSFCPDVCPFDLSRNAIATDILQERNREITPIFISVDPKRDTPEVVGEFADNLHERMIGLTGTPAQVKAASQAYRTYYKAQPADDEFYLVDHSTFSYLVLPEHGFVEFFRREIQPEQMADTIQCFIDNA